MNRPPVFCVLTRDKGISFLRNVFIDVKRNLDSCVNVEMTTLLPNDVSKAKCFEKIMALPVNSTVIIFIHGGTGYLTLSRDGCRLAAGGIFDIPTCVCKNKHVILVACNSSSLIDSLKKNGALSAVGFGLIDFACDDLYRDEDTITICRKSGKRPTRECIAKYLFRAVLTQTIVHCATPQFSSINFINYFHYFSNYYADKLLLKKAINGCHINISRRKRILIANFLQRMKEQVSC